MRQRRIGVVLHAICAGWDETRVEHLLVHIGLEELLEARGLDGDVVGGAQLRFNGNGELVRRVAGEAEAFRIIGDEQEIASSNLAAPTTLNLLKIRRLRTAGHLSEIKAAHAFLCLFQSPSGTTQAQQRIR